MELTDEVYLDPAGEELIDAGSVEVATDGATEETRSSTWNRKADCPSTGSGND
ncbi:MAG: hypothetical protein SVU32_06730 [Candidatus Nanohaloarchaea archaeon]|nr:hypothetical protein [Candidatus Nanohaloarchaea archaeon]